MDDSSEALTTDDAFADAAAVALDRAEAGDGTVTWADVSDAVPAERWGRLVDSDLLVATDAGFVFDDPDAVRSELAERAASSDAAAGADAAADTDAAEADGEADATGPDGWSTADKIAGACALGLMASYQVPMARDAIGSTTHLFFGPIEAALPFGATVALLAVATTVLTTTLRSRLTDGSERAAVKERLQQVSEQLNDARQRGDSEAVERLQARQTELMGEQLAVVKRMIRPMVWTMLVTIPIFLWLSWLTVNPAAAITPAAQILPFAGRVVWTARLVGPMQVWMVWYFVCSVLSNVLGKRVGKRVAGRVGPVVSG